MDPGLSVSTPPFSWLSKKSPDNYIFNGRASGLFVSSNECAPKVFKANYESVLLSAHPKCNDLDNRGPDN